eukprot:CAMPEP_0175109396 /NCGR_PEP_ID=MMETSP0086_2-20121207/13325_1 /TAXON_ID=136419 /ORGANISM="Unknown Unknown, Strain D1" /LENGTH=46 /DNA_ID= /DNA_START= /DNA_END= /DNA_ORIENTATION=
MVEYFPAWHKKQRREATWAENVPGLQSVQVLAPAVEENRPTSQAAH